MCRSVLVAMGAASVGSRTGTVAIVVLRGPETSHGVPAGIGEPELAERELRALLEPGQAARHEELESELRLVRPADAD